MEEKNSLELFRFENIEVEQITINSIEYFNARKIAKCMGYKNDSAAVQNFIQRYYDEIKSDVIVIQINQPFSLSQIGRSISGVDISNAYISYKGIEKWGMVARTEKGKRFREALAEHLEKHRKREIIEIDKAKISNLNVIERIHKENTLIINELKTQAKILQEHEKEIQEIKEKTQLITQREFWTLFNKIKELKSMGDKKIWRDFERVFRISNLGQLPACEYQSALAFLEERKVEVFRKQRQLF